MSVFGTWAVWVTDEIGQTVLHDYVTLTAEQRERARSSEYGVWQVLEELANEPVEETS